MAHVEARCLPFGPKWVLIKKRKRLGNKMPTPHNGSSGGTMPTFWPRWV